MIVVRSHPSGPRCYVAGRRLHHGAFALGVAGAAAIARKWAVVTVALIAFTHDARDFPFRDTDNH